MYEHIISALNLFSKFQSAFVDQRLKSRNVDRIKLHRLYSSIVKIMTFILYIILLYIYLKMNKKCFNGVILIST